MTIGQMDQTITLQRQIETSDGIGGVTKAWGPVPFDPDVWAKVSVRAGGEAQEDGRMNARQSARFEIWNRADLSEMNRIIWNGEAWNIRSVLRSSSRRATIILVAERGAVS